MFLTLISLFVPRTLDPQGLERNRCSGPSFCRLMEFDWIDCHFDLKKITPREVEEAFEDPFSIRLLPESDNDDSEARYFSLGKTLNARFLFSVFWTDGKNYRVIFCREMEAHEETFYERKNAEWV